MSDARTKVVDMSGKQMRMCNKHGGLAPYDPDAKMHTKASGFHGYYCWPCWIVYQKEAQRRWQAKQRGKRHDVDATRGLQLQNVLEVLEEFSYDGDKPARLMMAIETMKQLMKEMK